MTAYYNEIDPYASAWLRNLADVTCAACTRVLVARGEVER